MPQLTPADRDYLDRAPLTVSTDVDMPATRDEIWAAIADSSTWTEWFVGCRSCEGEPQVWTAAGQTRRIHVGALKLDEVAAEIVPGERWVMSVTRANVPLAKRLVEMLELIDTSTADEVRTEVRWTAGVELPALLRPVGGTIGDRFVRTWGSSLENLNDYLAARR